MSYLPSFIKGFLGLKSDKDESKDNFAELSDAINHALSKEPENNMWLAAIHHGNVTDFKIQRLFFCCDDKVRLYITMTVNGSHYCQEMSNSDFSTLLTRLSILLKNKDIAKDLTDENLAEFSDLVDKIDPKFKSLSEKVTNAIKTSLLKTYLANNPSVVVRYDRSVECDWLEYKRILNLCS